MSDIELLGAIQNALAQPGWDESIAGVKAAVQTALKQLDPAVEITDTRYFNHSFVPDFTLKWPGSTPVERDLFLRVDAGPEFLTEDMRFLDASEPILMGVSAPIQQGRNGDLRQLTMERGTLVTDPAAVVELFPRAQDTFSQILPSALLRGGRGVVDDARATQLQIDSAEFFTGAREHNADRVREAASMLKPFLSNAEADRLTDLGRVVWDAAGRALTRFPLDTHLAGISDEALRFLLREGPTDDARFWRSVGSSISTERLIALRLSRSDNLRSLVAANLDHLVARVLVVRRVQTALGEDEPYWDVDNGALTLHGSDFVAHFAGRKEDITAPFDEVGSIGIEGFQARVQRAQSVALATVDGKTITIESATGLDLSRDDVFASVARNRVEGVKWVNLIVPGKTLRCRFDDRTASGYGNSLFDLNQLLSVALPVLWEMRPRDERALRAMRAFRVSALDRPTLFDAELLDASNPKPQRQEE